MFVMINQFPRRFKTEGLILLFSCKRRGSADAAAFTRSEDPFVS